MNSDAYARPLRVMQTQKVGGRFTWWFKEVAAFLRSMKVDRRKAYKEDGYSGFLERLVRGSEEFKAYMAGKEASGEE